MMASTTQTTLNFAENHTNHIITTIISSLSIFGSIIIIFTYFLFPSLQRTSRKILVYISIGDFLTVYPTLVITWKHGDLVRYNNSIDCKTQSFVTTTAVMWSFLWTTTLALYIYINLVKKRPEIAERVVFISQFINWVVPLAITVTAWCFDLLGSASAHNSGGWCWIKASGEAPNIKEIIWMFAAGKLFEITSYFMNTIFYFIITKKIRSDIKASYLSGDTRQVAIQGYKKLIMAPVLFVFLRIWGTIRFILFCFDIKPSFDNILIICHIIGDLAQGFVNFLLFCVFTQKFRENCCNMRHTLKKQNKSGLIDDNSLPTKNLLSENKYIYKNPGLITFYT